MEGKKDRNKKTERNDKENPFPTVKNKLVDR